MSQPDGSQRSRAAAWVPEVAGILTADQVISTGHAIAAVQQPDGAIGWPDGHVDAWNHVECAMALSACGLRDAARRAYEWLRSSQRPDGSWLKQMPPGQDDLTTGDLTTGDLTTGDLTTESNHAAYCAVGVWHELLVCRDEGFAQRMWPTVRAAIDFVLGLQTPRGEIIWRRAADGTADTYALLAGSSSMYSSLRCAIMLADYLADPQPDWELAADQLAHAVARHPEAFADKSRFSMDWYYPVLGGPVRGQGARDHLDKNWDTYVVPGFGVRCVHDEPWVTAAETAELAIALEAIGDASGALDLLDQIQLLRDPTGAYWTGWQYVTERHYPDEQSSYTSAAIVLAADALCGATGGSSLFRDVGADPAVIVQAGDAVCGCDPRDPAADGVPDLV
ncbi:MAG TPA: prenyltransferase [Streptosporangiaceae bacterium]